MGSVCLTSVSVGGLVEHEHGIVNLRETNNTVFYATLSLLPHGILPDLSPSQVLQGGSATDGQKRRGVRREGRDWRRATGYKGGGQGGKDRKI